MNEFAIAFLAVVILTAATLQSIKIIASSAYWLAEKMSRFFGS